jgi:hypothetical protein
MKTIAIVGIALIVIGLAALASQGFTYTTHETAAKKSDRGFPGRCGPDRSYVATPDRG